MYFEPEKPVKNAEVFRMIHPPFLIENAYRVLRLPAATTYSEILKAADRIKRAAFLGALNENLELADAKQEAGRCLKTIAANFTWADGIERSEELRLRF